MVCKIFSSNCLSYLHCKALPTSFKKIVSETHCCPRFVGSVRFLGSSSDKLPSLSSKCLFSKHQINYLIKPGNSSLRNWHILKSVSKKYKFMTHQLMKLKREFY